MPKNDVNLDHCLKCFYCDTACPVMQVAPAYPGPKRLGPEWERIRLEHVDSDSNWVEYCTGCGQCDLACPQQVKVSEMIARAKAEHAASSSHRFRDRLLAKPAMLGKLGSAVPALTNITLGPKPLRTLLSACLDTASEQQFPAYHRPMPLVHDKADGKERVLFFPGCFVRYNAPEVGEATVEVLRKNGFAVEMADFACCGLPSIANGDRQELLSDVRKNLALMQETAERGGKIVTGCPSCGLTLKEWYPALFEEDDPLQAVAQKVAEGTFDLGQLLLSLRDTGAMNSDFSKVDVKLGYHAPCHTKAQGIGLPWVDLLRDIPGVQITDVDAGCCGMAGTYGFKKEKYQISMDIGKPLFKKMRDSHFDRAASECGMCQTQIGHGAGIKTTHPVQVLARAYGLHSEL